MWTWRVSQTLQSTTLIATHVGMQVLWAMCSHGLDVLCMQVLRTAQLGVGAPGAADNEADSDTSSGTHTLELLQQALTQVLRSFHTLLLTPPATGMLLCTKTLCRSVSSEVLRIAC